MTERLHFIFSLSHIGEGNGNPLQCSCLENSRDGGTWWAAVYGVAQSRTQLKWLSSSSREAWRAAIHGIANSRTWLSDWTDWGVERNWWKRRTSLSFIFLLTPILSVQSEVKWVKVTFLPRKRKVKVAQSCLTLCNSMDCNSSGSSVHGILQARILVWVAISFFRGLPDPGIEPMSLMYPVLAGGFFITSTTWKAQSINRRPKLVNKWEENIHFLFTNLTNNSYARKRKDVKNEHLLFHETLLIFV